VGWVLPRSRDRVTPARSARSDPGNAELGRSPVSPAAARPHETAGAQEGPPLTTRLGIDRRRAPGRQGAVHECGGAGGDGATDFMQLPMVFRDGSKTAGVRGQRAKGARFRRLRCTP
jgi:hypothetical protein